MILHDDPNNRYTQQLTNPEKDVNKLRFATVQFENDLVRDCCIKKTEDGYAVFI